MTKVEIKNFYHRLETVIKMRHYQDTKSWVIEKAGVKYPRYANNKTLLRVLNAHDVVKLALFLDVSIDFLLLGNTTLDVASARGRDENS